MSKMDNGDIRNMIMTLRRDAMYRQHNVAVKKRKHMWYYFNRWKAHASLVGQFLTGPKLHSMWWHDNSEVMGEIGELIAEAFQRHLMKYHRN